MTLQSKISLAIGYSTYGVLFYSILIGQPTIVMEFVSYSPAPLFAGLILLFTPRVTINRGVVFFVFCCALYYTQLYFIIELIADKNYFQLLIPVMSCSGAMLVSLVYCLLFKYRLGIKKDILRPCAIGLLVSIPTLIASFFDPFSDELIDQIVAIGFYSIFPFWIVTMSKHLLTEKQRLA